MNGYKYYLLKKFNDVGPYEDFIIGLIDDYEFDVKVSDLIRIANVMQVASLGTIHNAMQSAIDKGFIELKTDKQDRRIKVLKHTAKGRSYLKELRAIFSQQ